MLIKSDYFLVVSKEVRHGTGCRVDDELRAFPPKILIGGLAGRAIEIASPSFLGVLHNGSAALFESVSDGSIPSAPSTFTGR